MDNTTVAEVRATRAEDIGVFSALVWFVPHMLYHLLRIVVYWIPSTFMSYFLALLGRQFSFTLTFSSLLLLLCGLIAVIWALIRYRYLTKYSRLPPEPQRQEPKMDLYLDNAENETKSGVSSYLDDFLSAIKVFGYLDRTVFHELTKQMKTCKLEAGETMKLKDEKGFAIVVDGTIQIFAKSNEDESRTSLYDHQTIDGKRHQLLNEVNRGEPLSSLFTILSLFTEDVQLNENLRSPSTNPTQDTIPEMSLDDERQSPKDYPEHQPFGERGDNKTDAEKLSEELIAKASVNSTVAIIPEQAFRNLTRKFPKATSHIVQVILTRCQRVTFQTGHYYLGLTSEMFQPEIELNLKAKYELPSYLLSGAVRRLNKLSKQYDDVEKVSLSSFCNGPAKKKKRTFTLPRQTSRQVVLEPDSSHPGDLLSNVPLPRREFGPGAPSPHEPGMDYSGEDETEDGTLRAALAECIFKFLGLDGALMQAQTRVQSTVQSVTGSPLFTSADSFRSEKSRKSSFGYLLNNLGHLDAEEGDDDAVSNGTSPRYENAQREAAEAIDVVFYKKGSILSRQNEKSPGLYYVVDGILEVGHTDKGGVYRELYTVKPGGLGGYIGTILGYRSFADIRARTDVYLGFLPRAALEDIADRYPMVYLNLAKTLTSVLSRLILNLDFALDWVQVQAGQVLFNQDDDADSIYIVLNGRLRSVEEKNGKLEVTGEYGQGDSIGELEVLTESARPYTLHAIRESELAKFPRALFENLALQHPAITFEISKLVASRVRKRVDDDNESQRNNFKTVAIVPVTYGLPVMDFGQKLLRAYEDNNMSARLLNNATVLSYLGRNAFNKMGRLKLSGFLADLEERFNTVLYVADTNVNALWTRTCISQADCILLVANALTQPEIGEYERLLVKMKTTAKTELILLHPDRYVVPGSTALWLKDRIWVHSHHHVQMQVVDSPQTENTFAATAGPFGKLRSKVQTLQSELMIKYRSRRTPIYASNYLHKNDFNRLARILSGQAVGLVLGGGGARGISHIGIIRALEENGVPIDLIGGTSIGSFVGGLYAKEYDLVPIYGRAKKFAGRVGSLWRMLLDMTYPATSYTTGHEFNRGIWKTFGDSRIEDFWVKYYANTTNITHSRMEIHTSGYSWRYIRASMSLAGLLPPLTDKGSMLLDGGYVDNLPVAEMRSLGAQVIFAVDVGSIDDTTPMSYGDSLSGLWAIFNRWNFFSRHPNVPNMAEIQQRLAYVSSVGALEKAKNTPGVIYLRPPIDNYATLDFGKFDEIYQVGTTYARDFIGDLKDENKMPVIPGAGSNKSATRKPVSRRNSI